MASGSLNFDILVLGATGFTGKLITRYLYAHPQRSKTSSPNPGQFTFAIAGRSQAKLQELSSTLNLDSSVSIIQVDVTEPRSINVTVKQAKIVINTVGPFWTWGTPVVRACAQNSVHYVDITGEQYWIRDIINEFHYFATKSNTLIIPACGMDSIPSDFAVYLANKALKAVSPANEAPLCIGISVSAYDVVGSVSGGSVSTAMTAIESVPSKIMAESMADWSLSPVKGLPSPRPRLTYALPRRTSIVGGFWFMAAMNRSIVQRTAGLQQAELLRLRAQSSVSTQQLSEQERLTVGPRFVYEEFKTLSNKLKAAAWSVGLAVFGMALMVTPLRWIIKKFLPAPGTGPSETAMQNGHITVTNISTSIPTPTSPEVAVESIIRGRGDPGYLLTALMISEAALSILFSRDELPTLGKRGGVLTPASALGDVLVKRLEATGRFEFEYGLVKENGHESRKTI